MQIRPIRSDKDHRAALAEIEKLWGASSGTPEGDKLDILVTLVETYEERRWPPRSRRRFENPGRSARSALSDRCNGSLSEVDDFFGAAATLECIWRSYGAQLLEQLPRITRRSSFRDCHINARSCLRSSRASYTGRA
jgi:antitoxin component HigA of HigAB toxin-antitoxin module